MSNTSKGFQSVIAEYIHAEKEKDGSLVLATENPKKTIADCCNYIVQQAKVMKSYAMTNDEVFALAKAYYLDTKITTVKKEGARVVVTSDKAGEAAKPKAPAKPKKAAPIMGSLFDF